MGYAPEGAESRPGVGVGAVAVDVVVVVAAAAAANACRTLAEEKGMRRG